MKIIDAIWEKRNIGVQTIEATVEYGDSKQTVLDRLQTLEAEYLVVKVPCDYEPVSFELAQMGYVFSETMHRLESDLNLKPLTDPVKLQIVRDTQFVAMDDKDFQNMCAHITGDLMFQTDRIARDPHFTLEQANQRYVYWLQSERERGAQLFQYVYQGQDVGFECVRHAGGVYQRVLYGVYKEFSGRHLSVNCTYQLNEYAKAAGGQKVVTNISSSNVRSLKTHINRGFWIEESAYVFVKHSKR